LIKLHNNKRQQQLQRPFSSSTYCESARYKRKFKRAFRLGNTQKKKKKCKKKKKISKTKKKKLKKKKKIKKKKKMYKHKIKQEKQNNSYL